MASRLKMKTDSYVARRFKTRADWLRGRMETVGASEVSLVMGIAPKTWGDANSLWERKRTQEIDEGGNADTIRGSLSEEHIRELLQIEHPDLKVLDGTGIIFRSVKFPWLSCSLDGLLMQPDGSFVVLEIKNVRYTAHWKNGAYPRYYRYQCAAQMLVTGAKAAILLPRITYDFGRGRDWMSRLCNTTVRETPILIRRSEVKGQFAGIVRETREFMDAVKNGTPPVVRIGR